MNGSCWWLKFVDSCCSAFCPSGRAVQSLVVFKTSGALQWLSMNGHMSLLEQTGLAQAVHEGRTFRSSTITNITLGGEPRLEYVPVDQIKPGWQKTGVR